jgi:hypothetical protein
MANDPTNIQMRVIYECGFYNSARSLKPHTIMYRMKPEHCAWALQDPDARVKMICVSRFSKEYAMAESSSMTDEITEDLKHLFRRGQYCIEKNIHNWLRSGINDWFEEGDEDEKVKFMKDIDEDELEDICKYKLEAEGVDTNGSFCKALLNTIDWEQMVKDVKEDCEDEWCEFIANKINKENGY